MTKDKIINIRNYQKPKKNIKGGPRKTERATPIRETAIKLNIKIINPNINLKDLSRKKVVPDKFSSPGYAVSMNFTYHPPSHSDG
jgi:hypothetical protein